MRALVNRQAPCRTIQSSFNCPSMLARTAEVKAHAVASHLSYGSQVGTTVSAKGITGPISRECRPRPGSNVTAITMQDAASRKTSSATTSSSSIEQDGPAVRSMDELLIDAVATGSLGGVQFLLNMQANTNACGSISGSAAGTKPRASVLYLAAKAGHKDIAAALLRGGADPAAALEDAKQLCDFDTASAVVRAVDGMEVAMRPALPDDLEWIERGKYTQEYVEKMDTDGRTALHTAVLCDDEGEVQRLLRFRADVNAQDTYGDTPLDIAIKIRRADGIVQLLVAAPNISQENKDKALHTAAWMARPSVMDTLLSAGASPTWVDKFGRTALLRAGGSSKSNNADTARVVCSLIAAGASVDALDNGGRSLIMQAAKCGKVDVMQALIGAGAKLDVKDKEGHTALWHAAAGEHEEAVRLLLAADSAKNDWPTSMDNANPRVKQVMEGVA